MKAFLIEPTDLHEKIPSIRPRWHRKALVGIVAAAAILVGMTLWRRAQTESVTFVIRADEGCYYTTAIHGKVNGSLYLPEHGDWLSGTTNINHTLWPNKDDDLHLLAYGMSLTDKCQQLSCEVFIDGRLASIETDAKVVRCRVEH